MPQIQAQDEPEKEPAEPDEEKEPAEPDEPSEVDEPAEPGDDEGGTDAIAPKPRIRSIRPISTTLIN
ncbi:hypothetical protein [Microcoleus sp. OTE_8_concoct_300]|uniref:hypothetical protein n=1 Tax=Microcoleus sp. OTE_8_concoct_300 TaxID=2964710 RepID=UPI00403F692B